MIMKSDAKLEEKPTCLKNDKKHSKPQKLVLWLIHFEQIINMWRKKLTELCFMILIHGKFEEKLTRDLENETSNLASFHEST